MTAVEELLAWYARCGRAHLPWRRTRDPYAIVVAEFMLQQTQVDRVVPLYTAFLESFPTFAALAASNAADVMRAWRGLGYNSRAQRLRALAQTVVADHAGTLPRERDTLLRLPGIGGYTAAAIRAFAYDADEAALDTNVRRVVHRMTIGVEVPHRAADAQIDALATAMIPAGRGHDWNSAMMDLGATTCSSRAPKCLLCPVRAHCVAAPIDAARLATLTKRTVRGATQATLPFARTTRFLRGRIIDRLRDVPAHAALAVDALQRELAPVVPSDRLAEIPVVVQTLIAEGIVAVRDDGLCLSSH